MIVINNDTRDRYGRIIGIKNRMNNGSSKGDRLPRKVEEATRLIRRRLTGKDDFNGAIITYHFIFYREDNGTKG